MVFVSRLTPSLVTMILRAFLTFWSASPSIISSVDIPARSGHLMIPRDVFKDAWGLHCAGIEKKKKKKTAVT